MLTINKSKIQSTQRKKWNKKQACKKKKKHKRKCWQVHKVFSNLQSEKMEEALALTIDLINKLGCTLGQAGLLTHQDFVTWKGLDAKIDVYCMKKD